MRSTPVIVGTVSSAVLIGAGVALHFLTPPDLEGRFRTAIGSVQAMQQLGAEWSVETARVRADPTANFDGLAAFVPRMHQLKANLTESLADIPSLPERLAADSRAYLAAMESLRERVERFKTAYAVIRNSERYFPLASADLMLRAEQAGNRRLSREVADISVEMDTYLSSPSVSSKNSLSTRLQALTGQGASETEEVAASIQNFAAHANVLLDRRARSQELFRGITSSTLSERTKPLTDVLETELEDRRRIATLHRQALTGLGAGVLLVWVGVGFARRSSASRRARLAGSPSKEGATSESRTEPGIALPPESSVEIAGDPHRDDDGMDAMEALIATHPFGPMHSDARAHDDADGHRDNDGMDAMDEMESLVSAQAPGAAPPGAREGGASGRSGTRIDVMEALLTGGALAGLMGQTVGGYARRIREDANVLVRDGDDAQTGEDAADPAQLLRRLRADARRIGFFAHRLVLLGRHLAPKDREGVDLKRCLDEVLNDAGVQESCIVERYFKAVPDVWASTTDVRLILAMCVAHVLRAFQGMDRTEAELEVWMVAAAGGVTISFIHNGAWQPADQRANQFVPFYGSQDLATGLQLPAARHLARKYGGTVELDSRPDERGVLSVHLSVDDGRQ